MLYKTRGVVFNTHSFSESSLVLKVFTEKFGVQSYFIGGVKKQRSKTPMSLFGPLNLLDLVVYHKPGNGLQKISEIRNHPIYKSIPFDMPKRSLAFFLNEVLDKSIKQEQSEPSMFDFLFNSLEWLDVYEKKVVDFHLVFLLKLTRYLGFYPSIPKEETNFFDLKSGLFTNVRPLHPNFLDKENSQHFKNLLITDFNALNELMFTRQMRKDVLNNIVTFYTFHVEAFGFLNSVKVLELIFEE